MALFNYATKEITLKIVYYGPGLSGKTTNLQYLHSVLNPNTRGKLLSLSTEADRTLFFDFLPVELGKLKDFTIRFQLYTVPGQVRYNATRKVVLKGADAVVFVADSQQEMREQNIESFENMRENLSSNNIDPDETPVVLQYNKRDLRNILSVDELNSDLNARSYRFIEASAIDGAGVEESFKLVTRLMIEHISKKHKIEIQPMEAETEAIPARSGETFRPQEVSTRSFAPPPSVERYAERTDISGVKSIEPRTEPRAGEKPPVVSYPSVEGYEETVAISDKESIDAQKESRAENMRHERAVRTGSFASPEAGEAPDVLIEKLDRLTKEVEEIKGILLSLKTTATEHTSELQRLDGIKKEMEKNNVLLRDILTSFTSPKKKKTWFRFF